jgi:UDP-glucose 4-epimerase
MRVTVVGATGNVGTSVLRSLIADPAVDSIVGIARRAPAMRLDKVEWVAADVVTSDLVPIFRGSHAVIHLAWVIQPSHDRTLTKAVNQDGSQRVFAAVADAEVPALIYASSSGAYSPGPKEHGVDESWPTNGISTSFYSVDKATVESMLDSFQNEHPEARVVRLRPSLIFKREAGAEIRRLFAGPLLPSILVQDRFLRLITDVPDLRFQCVHSHDIGDAYRLAAVTDARGAYNLASDPILDPPKLSEMFGARLMRVSPRLIKAAADLTWRLHLQPSPRGWVDMGLEAPIMDTKRARVDLGWEPHYTSQEALLDLMDGLRHNAGMATPPLDPGAGGPLRMKEFATRIGKKA